jgi:hypothetical protein
MNQLPQKTNTKHTRKHTNTFAHTINQLMHECVCVCVCVCVSYTQEESVNDLAKAEDTSFSLLDGINKYFMTRGKLVSRMVSLDACACKYSQATHKLLTSSYVHASVGVPPLLFSLSRPVLLPCFFFLPLPLPLFSISCPSPLLSFTLPLPLPLFSPPNSPAPLSYFALYVDEYIFFLGR